MTLPSKSRHRAAVSTYQWYWQGELISGATGSVLEYPNAYSTANAGYYQVVVSNMIGTASSPPPGLLFLKPAPGGKYQGIFLDESAPDVPSSGRIEFNLSSSKKAFSGKATILDQIYKFSGVFSDAHDTAVTATSKTGGTPLSVKDATFDNQPDRVPERNGQRRNLDLAVARLPF